MKQFIFDIDKKEVTKEGIKLLLKPRGDFQIFIHIDEFKNTHLDLIGRKDDIKITDKIIVSFDINQVNHKDNSLQNLLSDVKLPFLGHAIETPLIRLRYLIDYYIKNTKAPVAE